MSFLDVILVGKLHSFKNKKLTLGSNIRQPCLNICSIILCTCIFCARVTGFNRASGYKLKWRIE
ncbi:hypothetical protein PUN28_019029 [Cardiocondyla obscurior]|uniref:Uncharacterized protein n=1 Tax=Cardiocondyla obscurior TaxID=286306 RepID=A0AAW2EH80_9HYME